MKKLMLPLAVVLVTCTIVAGQDLIPVQFGIKAGANSTKIDGQSFNNEYRLNYLMGA